MKIIVWILKKSEVLSALSIRLVYLTGKSKVPVHPKHIIRTEKDIWYKDLLSRNKVILDAGCGSGQHSTKIAKHVKQVVGLDKDLRSLDIAKKDVKNKRIYNCQFINTDLEKILPLKDSSIDVAILFDVLEHIKKRQGFLREIKRVLKKDGKALVVIPNIETSWKKLQRRYGLFSYSDPDHKIEYTEKGIIKELTNVGFKIQKVDRIGYDTPFVGIIDLVGGISLTLYKKLSKWKKQMGIKYPEDCSGFQIIVSK